MKAKNLILEGIVTNNPIFIMVLGMCPVLGITNTLNNAFWLGVSTCFVLILSNFIISLVGKIIPDKVRIPCYIIIIATLTTLIDMLIRKFLPGIYTQIGRFIQIIVVNCIILARAEAFAASNEPKWALLDGVSVGAGYLLGLFILGLLREFLGAGEIAGINVLPEFSGIQIFSIPAGAFIMLAILMAIYNYIKAKIEKKQKIKKALLRKAAQTAQGGKA
ncbi:MAG TPA: electron transport complex subunit RsxE [Clostridiales bacterium]|jgi:electron transport complex protein RnfE|nr:electron transport complex subunit RsxE [Clostridiales bacterium]